MDAKLSDPKLIMDHVPFERRPRPGAESEEPGKRGRKRLGNPKLLITRLKVYPINWGYADGITEDENIHLYDSLPCTLLHGASWLSRNRSSVDLCVEAPLALLEVDILRSDGSDQSDLVLLSSRSHTDLVLNFNDRAYKCFNQPIEQSVASGTTFASTVANAKAPLVRDANLSAVKCWWKGT
ncbi:hypothetical protein T265_10087 [Opisthorchis viverrini]|uniref:Uncharacterized protein n=1 Tax=Opisthorchis viverrini TaxID=6198 RepID=A0A074Z3N4_OPIVI|nr:hypothetical protein T265_10087 [Opisthorchis viverrini]KER21643.1 hypothetical protein T265_10087 [Opisthorchis viverrini]